MTDTREKCWVCGGSGIEYEETCLTCGGQGRVPFREWGHEDDEDQECDCCGKRAVLTRCWLGPLETFACDECRKVA